MRYNAEEKYLSVSVTEVIPSVETQDFESFNAGLEIVKLLKHSGGEIVEIQDQREVSSREKRFLP